MVEDHRDGEEGAAECDKEVEVEESLLHACVVAVVPKHAVEDGDYVEDQLRLEHQRYPVVDVLRKTDRKSVV